MRSNKSVVVAVSSAAASAVAGFMLGRKRSSGAVRRKAASLVGGNVGWMTADEQCLVSTLASCGQAHLFRNWPAPGEIRAWGFGASPLSSFAVFIAIH